MAMKVQCVIYLDSLDHIVNDADAIVMLSPDSDYWG